MYTARLTLEAELITFYLQVAASPLSRHYRNPNGECVAIDPTSDPVVAELVQKAKTAGPGDQRLFTLVDTGESIIHRHHSASSY